MSDAAAAKGDARYKLIGEAQTILLKELPALPLWYQNATAVTDEGPQGVHVQLAAEARLLRTHQVVGPTATDGDSPLGLSPSAKVGHRALSAAGSNVEMWSS